MMVVCCDCGEGVELSEVCWARFNRLDVGLHVFLCVVCCESRCRVANRVVSELESLWRVEMGLLGEE